MILSIHIPKTAGVTFRSILARTFEADFLLSYWKMTDATGEVVAEVPLNTRCIHGHFAPEVFLPRFPDAKLITWVRDPVERVVSSYCHRLRDPDLKHPVTRELHEKKLSLLQFAALDLMRNEMSRFFGQPAPARYAFVGLTEEYELGLELFFRVFDLPAVPVWHENCNPDRNGVRYAIDIATRRKVAALNEQDCDLYFDCRRRYCELYRRHLLVA